MKYKEGSMSIGQLRDEFGDIFDENGNLSKDANVDDMRDNSQLRRFFVQGLGRSTDDWDDDVSFHSDVDHAMDNLLKEGGGTTEKKPETNQWSQPMAEARAGVTAYENTVLPNAGDYITGKKKDMQGDYLKDYKLNLAKELKPTNADGSARDSAIQDKKEEDAVQGFS